MKCFLLALAFSALALPAFGMGVPNPVNADTTIQDGHVVLGDGATGQGVKDGGATLPCANLPSLGGDVSSSGCALTVNSIQGAGVSGVNGTGAVVLDHNPSILSPTLNGTTTVTGTAICNGTAVPCLQSDGPPSTNRQHCFYTSGVLRWCLREGGSDETGSNAGSNLNIDRYDDSGALIDTPFKINRQTGQTTITTLNPSSLPVLKADSASLGGSALAAGACSSTTVSITGATPGMTALATPNGSTGDAFFWKAYVSTLNQVTVKVCAAVAGTPTAQVYHVAVIQ